ncbi:unnamed protein product [Diatraea saccharalis]|uniref:Peptidase S1 domain-containing protein n=1 Tax=Diatraea saccharalis TaxID=40085 RepID=A0A9N9R9M3_9NEOP|nr:unnamed protein product [Diatraea saccharalis]
MYRLFISFAVLGVVVSTPTLKAKEDARIVGGDDIDITDAPYQVSLVNRGSHSCGGTIVSSDIVITAAHCVMGSNPANYQIRAGSSFSGHGGELYPVGDLLAHPDFSYSKMDNDIAVIWMAKPFEFNEKIAAIDMYELGNEIDDGDDTTVTGWGNTREGGGFPSTLQRVMVPKVSEQMCNKAYAPIYTITPRMLCAGSPTGGKDACQGDSGGPLVHNNKLAGVVSWGLGCARPQYPGIYAKISTLRTWIDEHILYLRMKNVLRALP